MILERERAEIVDALMRRSMMLRQVQSESGPLVFEAARPRPWTASPLDIIYTVWTHAEYR
jgi:hypothetical protein